MELELGLGPPCATTVSTAEAAAVDMKGGATSCSNRKRRYEEAFDQKTTLPLFDGCDDDNDRSDDVDGEVADSSCSHNCKQVFCHSRFRTKDEVVVGWPPVKCSWTKGDSEDTEQGSYIKVTMEGVAIGRKVDLALHNSYQELLTTLGRMFPYRNPNSDGNVSNNLASSNHHHDDHMVTYEDEDGDWMLIGDLPWEAFVKSVKRIKIVGLSKQEEAARNY